MKLKEKLRLKRFEIELSPVHDLMFLCFGQGIINNPNITRIDDPETGDIVFYEKKEK